MFYHLKSISLIAVTFLLTLYPSSSRVAQSSILTNSQSPIAQAPTPTPEEKITKAVYLNQDGWTEIQSGNVPGALKKFQEALAIFKQYNAKGGEAQTLNNIGAAYLYTGEYSKSLAVFQQALAINKQIGEKEPEIYTLEYLGETYGNLYQYPQALEHYQKALAIYKELGDKIQKANENNYVNLLQSTGGVYFKMGQYPQALEFYQQLLPIYDRGISRAQVLNNIGVVHANVGKYAEALNAYQQALDIARNTGDCYRKDAGSKLCFYGDEAAILNNLSTTYFSLGQYQKALESAENSSTIYRKFREGEYQGTTKSEIKLLYDALGQNSQALQSLPSRANVGDAFGKDAFQRQGEALNLNNIGQIYFGLGKYDQAIKLYQQALGIYKEIDYKVGLAVTLNHIGQVYQIQGKYDQARTSNEQALTIYQEISDRTGEGVALSNLGQVYEKQGQSDQAMKLYQQALPIHKQVGDRVSEGGTLKQIGALLSTQNQPELAVVFLKESVNVTEKIRQELRNIPVELQKSYTGTVAERYRLLADILLKQNRAGEAQQVLDLLKVQEIDDYMRDDKKSNVSTPTGNATPTGTREATKISRVVSTLPQEEQVSQKYANFQDKAIVLGKELTGLRKIPAADRKPEQKQRILELEKIQQQLSAQFNEFINSPDVTALVKQLNQTAQQQNLNLSYLNSLRDNLRRSKQNAVLLYPLVLEDRIELVLLSADAPPIHRSVAVKQQDVEKAIASFRESLQKPYSDAKKPANKLYELLIQPIEADLKAADAKTIIYAADGKLRYIPLSALYDGNQWLVQRFRINNITAASLTEFNSQPSTKLHVLAAAFTQGNYNVEVAERQYSFAGLPFAALEVQTLQATVPGTTKILDNAFSRDATVAQMNDFNIVHLATHAAFVPGEPSDSFILFGNGDRATLRDVSNWSLPNVDLVVLSACQTGLGGQLGNGEEVLGLGFQMQKTGAKAIVASLWSVSDGGTQALMDAFYAALQKGNISKSEALRQAQIALITGDFSALGQQRGGDVQQRIDSNLPEPVRKGLDHPYYWAPFILVGNGL